MDRSLIIRDPDDGTFHYGDGIWGCNPMSAMSYGNATAVAFGIAELDPERCLDLRVAVRCNVCGRVDGECTPVFNQPSKEKNNEV